MPDTYNGRTKIHYEVTGSGPDLLFIPGLGVGVHEMQSLIAPLSEHFTVTAIDNRGVGFSDKPHEDYSIELMAADAVAVLNAAGIDRINVFGYSMGGRVAMELALAHPDRVDRLVLLATGARTTPTLSRRVLFTVAPYLNLGPKPRQPVYAHKLQRAASEGYDARERLHEIDAATLILHGRSDRVALPLLADELHAGIPGSRLEWYDGGHIAPMMRPAPIVESIRTFLA